MKKFFTLIASVSFLFASGPREAHAQSPGHEKSSAFTTDIVMEANTLANQRHVHIASAYNGWLFAAYVVNDTSTHKGGVVVRYSKNGGINWYQFNGYPYFQHSWYGDCDIAVAGADTNHLAVYVCKIRKDETSRKYEIEVDKQYKYYLPSVKVYFQQLDTNKVYDAALSTDSRQPVSTDSLYSIGILYSHHGPVSDSLIFQVSKKAGKTWGMRHVVATGNYFGKVSLGYSHSASVHGVYHAAWERFSTPAAIIGNVYTSRTNDMNIDSVWMAPVCLDSMSLATAGLVRSPSIACQVNATDNDSTNTTVAVSFDVNTSGNYDIAGYYNKRADSTNFWYSFSVAATANKEIQSNMSYDNVHDNMMVTYYDSTAGKLIYANQSNLMTTPNAWTVISAQYNDATNNLKNAWPHVCVNALTGKAALAWIVDPANNNGVAMFDGEYLMTSNGPELSKGGISVRNIYPNPASTNAYLTFTSDKSVNAKLSVLNVLGENVLPVQNEYIGGGEQTLSLDITSLPAGIYLCHIEAGTFSHTLRFIVQR